MMTLRRLLWFVGLVCAGVVGIAPAAQAANGPWVRVVAGNHNTCAINSVGSLYCWGDNSGGQIGDGTVAPHLSPHRVGAAGVWADVAIGELHTCGVTKAKNLYCWGSNDYGELGAGDTDARVTMVRVGGVGVWTSVTAGNTHTCGITTGKNLYCWGLNDEGQVGDGMNSPIPHVSLYRVGAAGVWARVSAGKFHTCGITTGKNLYCWGYNTTGQVGNGISSPRQLILYRVGAAGVWSNVSAGRGHTCGITTAKNLYCWGYNAAGQVGKGSVNDSPNSPYRVGGAGVWGGVSAGDFHTCGITTAKNLYCWGNNNEGQIGDGTTNTPRLSLYRVAAAGVWTNVSGGWSHTCGITTGKNLYCWGFNGDGEMGDGTTDTPRLSLYRVT